MPVWISQFFGGVLLVSTLLNTRTPAKEIIMNPASERPPQEVVLPLLPDELMRAGGCESNHSATSSPKQFKEDGTLVIHKNKDGSVDRGAFQINSVHDKEAKELELDPNKEADNYKLALHIYRTQGIRAWAGYDPARKTCSYY